MRPGSLAFALRLLKRFAKHNTCAHVPREREREREKCSNVERLDSEEGEERERGREGGRRNKERVMNKKSRGYMYMYFLNVQQCDNLMTLTYCL